MQKIVVTGATSMIGVALIEEAIRQNVKVLAIVRENSKRIVRLPKSNFVKIVSCDIENLDSINIEGEKYDVFYHLAWNYTDKEGRNNSILQAKNINTTLCAVELAYKFGCHKFVGAGSQAEYGKVDGIISPDTYTNPEVPYGIAKWAAGNLAKRLCDKYDMTHVWGRIFSVYGRYDNEGTMLTYAIDRFLEGEPAQFSAATQMWNYLNEHDAGKIFYLLGKKENVKGIYCIAHPESQMLREYIVELRNSFGENAECRFAENDLKSSLVGLQADVSKLISDINFTPEVSFKQGIREMIEYRRNTKEPRG